MFCFFQADEIKVGIAGHDFPFLFGLLCPFSIFSPFSILIFSPFILLFYLDFYILFLFELLYLFLLFLLIFIPFFIFFFFSILLVYIPLLRYRDQILDFLQILNFHIDFFSRQMWVMPNDLFPKGLTKLASWKLWVAQHL